MTTVSFTCANLALQPGAECALNPAHEAGFRMSGADHSAKRQTSVRSKPPLM